MKYIPLTLLRYFADFVQNREWFFILTAIKYKLFGQPAQRNSLIRTNLGLFVSRKGTIDFQFANYAYEWNVKRFVLDHYKNYDVFIDIGANIGTYAIMAAKLGMRAVAFEAIPDNLTAMHTNVRLNKLADKIKILDVGLADRQYETEFVFDTVNTGASHIARSNGNSNRVKVQMRTFDSLFEQMGIAPSDRVFMKIDVEGMEVEVINGAKQFLSSHQNLLLVLESIHSDADNISNALDRLGKFTYERVDKFNISAKKKL